MIDYTIRHAEDVPNFSMPPVHFDGIRYSGDASSNIWGVANTEFLNELLPTFNLGSNGCEREDIAYGTSSWFSQINAISGRPYVGIYSTGMKYQFFLGAYSSSGFPYTDSSRDFVVSDAKLNPSHEEPHFFPNYNDLGFCEADSNSSINFNYTPTGYQDIVSNSVFYSFGWGDTNEDNKLRFSPHLKEGNFLIDNRNTGWHSFPDNRKYGSIYQFGFLVGNECNEIELEFEIINEHPIIKWDFRLGACVNKKDVTWFDLSSKDEDLFVYDPKSDGEGGFIATGYYGSGNNICSSTKYKVSLRNVNTKESDGLVQVSLLDMDFNSRGEDYLPINLYNIITLSGSSGMNSEWQSGFSEYFWKGRYALPDAHHLRPWYSKAKLQNWQNSSGFFSAVESDPLYADEYETTFSSSSNHVYLDHGGLWNAVGGPFQSMPALGNFSDETSDWATYEYEGITISGSPYCRETRTDHRGFFINYGGFGKVACVNYDDGEKVFDKTIEFAPVSITVNNISAKRRVKSYYATLPIYNVVSGKLLETSSDISGVSVGKQVHHVCDFDYGHLGLVSESALTPYYGFIYNKVGNKIAIKETKTCDEDFCAYNFTGANLSSGVIRFLTNQPTGYPCRFESGSQFIFCPQRFTTGALVSFDYAGPAIRNFSALRGEDYVVSHVEETFMGGNDAYKFKIRTPRYNSDPAKSDKTFHDSVSGQVFVGLLSSDIKEMSPSNILDSDVELISVSNCSGVLPSLSTKYLEVEGYVVRAPVVYAGPCS